jgi:hypothetical protein
VQPSDCPTCGKTLEGNHAQLLAGMAWWYRYYAKEQSPEDRGRYESAEDAAHEGMGGLTVHPGTHPHMGQIVIVANREQFLYTDNLMSVFAY